MPHAARSTPLALLATIALVAAVAGCAAEPDAPAEASEPSFAESAELVMEWLPDVDGIDSAEIDRTIGPSGLDIPDIVAIADPALDVPAVEALIGDLADRLDDTVHAVDGYASIDLWHGDFVLHVSSGPSEQRDAEIAMYLRMRADERIVGGGSPILGYDAVVAEAAQASAVARDLWPHLGSRSLDLDSADGAVQLMLYGEQPVPDAELGIIDSSLARLGVGGAAFVSRDTGDVTFAIASAPGVSSDAVSTALAEAEAAGLAPAHVLQGPVSIDRDAFDATATTLMLALSGAAGVERVRISPDPTSSGVGSIAVANDEAAWRLLHATLLATPLPQGIEVRLRPAESPQAVIVASPPLAADSGDLAALAGVLQIEGARAFLSDGLELSLDVDAPDATAVALADLVAGSAWATAEVVLLGWDEDGVMTPIANLAGGTAAPAGPEDARATAFLDRWAELHGDGAVGGR